MARSVKAKLLEKEFILNPGEADKDTQKKLKNAVKQICIFTAGNKGDLKKLFFTENLYDVEKTGFKFSDTGFDEEILPELESKSTGSAQCSTVHKGCL